MTIMQEGVPEQLIDGLFVEPSGQLNLRDLSFLLLVDVMRIEVTQLK